VPAASSAISTAGCAAPAKGPAIASRSRPCAGSSIRVAGKPSEAVTEAAGRTTGISTSSTRAWASAGLRRPSGRTGAAVTSPPDSAGCGEELAGPTDGTEVDARSTNAAADAAASAIAGSGSRAAAGEFAPAGEIGAGARGEATGGIGVIAGA
jgi:hypothetical protein